MRHAIFFAASSLACAAASGGGSDDEPCETEMVATSVADDGDLETTGANPTSSSTSGSPGGSSESGIETTDDAPDDDGSGGEELPDPLALCSPSQAPLEPGEVAPLDPLDGPPIVIAQAWVIADADTGELLYGCRTDEQREMASTTKIMTSWIVLDLAADDPALLDEQFVVSANAADTGGSTAALDEGELITVRECLYGIMLPSGNDAAVAIAEHVGDRLPGVGGLQGFVDEMNARAIALGMLETNYLDPHGNSANVSSARDLVTLTMAAMQNATFREIVATRSHPPPPETPRWQNTNELLSIEGFDGIKTGSTGGAGGCLVASGTFEEDHLYSVVLGSEREVGRFIDTRNLFQWAWRQRLR